jgi:transglutaminase-like putative cysteine protease
VDAYIDRTVQLRQQTAPRRDYSFEISAVLCVALVAATAWAVLAAGWVHGGGGAIVVAVTSVIEAALLAQARAPRIATAIAAPFLGLAAIVPTTFAAMPSVPGQTAGTIASHYLSALFTGLASTQDWDFTVGLCAILFLCGYWLGWMVLREHRGVLAVIPVFSVLATNVVNAQNPDPIALPETIAVVLAIAAVAAAYLGSLGDRWEQSRITALDGLGWRFGTSAAGVAVVLTIIALLLPPVSTTDISARLFPHGLGAGGKGIHTVLGGTGTIGFNPSVTLGGPLVSHPQPVMSYTDNSNVPVYMRVADDVQFDNGSWFPQGGETADPADLWNGIKYSAGPLPRDTNPADGGVVKDETTVTATVTMQLNATGVEPLAPFTGDPASSNLPGTALGAVAAVSSRDLLTVDEVQLDHEIVAGTTIQTSAYTSTASEAQLRAAGINYPSWTNQYTAMTDDGSQGVETIRNLAQQWISGGPTDPYDEALAIEQHLRNPVLFQYTLNPPRDTDVSTWPVVYFLTTSHKGYCQYFASAMGSMLRSLNIPTRLVSGFGPGTARTETGRSGDRTQDVTTSDAHSWVEAYFPGYGWIAFEPTPPSSQGNYQPFPRGQQAGSSATPPPVTTAKPVPTVKPGLTGGQNPNVNLSGKARASVPAAVLVALAVLGGVIVLIVAGLLWMLLPRSLTGAWKRVETLGILSGVDRRRAETHRAFAERLARARPRAGSALTELASVAARSEFSATGATGPERARALRTWRRAFLAATLRPRRSPG